MADKDGGPAFPLSPTALHTPGYQEGPLTGMSLRDWFAGQAMVGIIHADELARAQVNPGGRYTTAPEFAKAAFEIADAMLKARKGE